MDIPGVRKYNPEMAEALEPLFVPEPESPMVQHLPIEGHVGHTPSPDGLLAVHAVYLAKSFRGPRLGVNSHFLIDTTVDEDLFSEGYDQTFDPFRYVDQEDREPASKLLNGAVGMLSDDAESTLVSAYTVSEGPNEGEHLRGLFVAKTFSVIIINALQAYAKDTGTELNLADEQQFMHSIILGAVALVMPHSSELRSIHPKVMPTVRGTNRGGHIGLDTQDCTSGSVEPDWRKQKRRSVNCN
jgi:hypothetical protein